MGKLTTEVAAQAAAQFPQTPTLTLAKKIYGEHPELYNSLEHARAMVRMVRGNHGSYNRKECKAFADLHRPNGVAGEPVFDTLPKPKSQFDAEWTSVPIDGKRKALVIQDVHIPYHDPCVDDMLRYGKKAKCDTVIFNGDIGDFYGLSQWDREPDKIKFQAEMEAMEQFLGYTRYLFPNADLWFKEGNHEERFWRYLKVKAPEFWGMPEFSVNALLHLDKFGYHYVKDMRPIKLGKLYVIHGHEYRFPISNPVNPARGLFLRAKTTAMCGHFHTASQHNERDLTGKTVTTWSMGCACDLHPCYRPLNNWGHGFGVIEVEADGSFHMDSKRIIDGKVF